jgi:hypothetical protein
MTDHRVGRLLPACLHQAIGEELADRLEFYEHWLRSETLRDGAVGLAAIRAVTGFLRTEPDQAYDRVTARAGALAAEWNAALLPGYRRAVIGWMPAPMRVRAAMRIARRLVGSTYAPTRASASVRGPTVRLDVASSVFCAVRDPVGRPLCGFYVALALATLRQFKLAAHGSVERCQAVTPGHVCRIALQLDGAAAAEQAGAA